jgi:hypothetical protein
VAIENLFLGEDVILIFIQQVVKFFFIYLSLPLPLSRSLSLSLSLLPPSLRKFYNVSWVGKVWYEESTTTATADSGERSRPPK